MSGEKHLLNDQSHTDTWLLDHTESPIDKADVFNLITPHHTPINQPVPTDTPPDILEQLKSEAELVLRHGNYIDRHQYAELMSDVIHTQNHDLSSYHLYDNHNESLSEFTNRDLSLSTFIGSLETLDEQGLLNLPSSPPILTLFAGDILTEPTDPIGTLTQREHHLISMDSAYQLAQADTSNDKQ